MTPATVAMEASAAKSHRDENKQTTRITAKPKGNPPKPARVLVYPRPGSIVIAELAAAWRGSRTNLKLIIANRPATARMIRRANHGESFKKFMECLQKPPI